MSLLFNAPQLQAKNIVVGVEDIQYFPHFDFTSNQATFSRIVLDQFALDQGHTITYVPLPLKQFSRRLYENDIDFKYPDNQRWHKANSNEHSAKYYSNAVVYLRAGTIVLLKNQDQPMAFFKNLGMISGFTPTQWVDKIANHEVNILRDTSVKMLIKHLAIGLVDGVDVDISVANHYLSGLGINAQLTYNTVLNQEIFSHQLSTIKYPEIIEQFNQWLANNQDFIVASRVKFNIPDEHPAD